MIRKLMITCLIFIVFNIGTVNCLEKHSEEENAMTLFKIEEESLNSDKMTNRNNTDELYLLENLEIYKDRDSFYNEYREKEAEIERIYIEEKKKEIKKLYEEKKKKEVIDSVINEGLLQLGKPYVYGAKGVTSFDCSMLMKHSMESEGFSFPRTSREQRSLMKHIKFEELQRGDFIFWHKGDISNSENVCHVAIYLGEGKMLQATPPKVVVSDVVKYKHKHYNISYGRYDYSKEM